MIIQAKIRGFICTTAHPQGCAQNVADQIQYIKQQPIADGPKKVLVIGASTGYGLASRITAAFGANAKTIGVFFEKEAEGKRTASAGWYNTAAFEQQAQDAGLYAKSINGDAFSDEVKEKTLQLIQQDWQGGVDLVIYSLASPRRTHPKTGKVSTSVLKPIGKQFSSKTIDVMTGQVSEITIDPASPEEIEQTIAVMGGEDWEMWIEALLSANLLAKNAITIAYSYIGPELTYPIYRAGTIGQAKANLEQTAHLLNKKLAAVAGRAYVSVNKALVTQASAAIPVVPLYISLLYRVMKKANMQEGCIAQIARLFSERLYMPGKQTPTDNQGLIRIDDWEMKAEIQQEVAELWEAVKSENVNEITDLDGYRNEFHQLFGFEVKGVDYTAETNPEVAIPSLKVTASVE